MTINPVEFAVVHQVYQGLAARFIDALIDPHVMLVLSALAIATEASVRHGDPHVVVAADQVDAVLAEVRALVLEIASIGL